MALQTGWVERAFAAGNWIIRRETAKASGCPGDIDCPQQWKMYLQDSKLREAPTLIASSSIATSATNVPVPASDGRVVVWQAAISPTTFGTYVMQLPNVHSVVRVAEEAGPAEQLALDGSGGVLVDTPDSAGSATTTLDWIDLRGGRIIKTGLRDAHWPAVMGSSVIAVTGSGGQLTRVEIAALSPLTHTISGVRIVYQGTDIYSAEYIDSEQLLIWDYDSIVVFNLATNDSIRTGENPDGEVCAGFGVVVLPSLIGPNDVIETLAPR